MKAFIGIVLLMMTTLVSAQTRDEWMHQKKTQIDYLHQQVAALSVYGSRLSQGYEIAKEGLKTIRTRKEGEYSLHDDFFRRLLRVHESVKKHSSAVNALWVQSGIVKAVSTLGKEVHNSRELTSTEKIHLQKLLERFIEDCENDIESLVALLSDAELEMRGEERVEHLKKIAKALKGKWMFVCSLSSQIKNLRKAREREKKDIEFFKRLNKIK